MKEKVWIQQSNNENENKNKNIGILSF